MGDVIFIKDGSGVLKPVSTDEVTIDGALQHLEKVKIALGANNAYQGDLAAGPQPNASSVPVTEVANSDKRIAQKDVTTTAVALLASALADRRYVLIRSVMFNTAAVYLGFSSGVTATGSTGGMELAPGESLALLLGTGIMPWAIAASGTQDVRLMELA